MNHVVIRGMRDVLREFRTCSGQFREQEELEMGAEMVTNQHEMTRRGMTSS